MEKRTKRTLLPHMHKVTTTLTTPAVSPLPRPRPPSSPDLLEDHDMLTVTTVTAKVREAESEGQVNKPRVMQGCSRKIIKTGTKCEVL